MSRTLSMQYAAGAMLLFACFASSAPAHHADGATSPDDGWRRTAQGWQHVSTWAKRADPLPPLASTSDVAHSPLARLHPAQLAVLQLVASIGLLIVGPFDITAKR